MFLKTLNFLTMTISTLLVLWVLGWVWFASAIAFGSANEVGQKAEAIIVLTGGNGRVSMGLDLLNDDIAPILFISGVNQGVTKDDIYNSWKNGPGRPCCVELGYDATDTAGNAVEVKNWVQTNEIESFVLVTSRYHMPRAYLEIRRALPNTEIFKHVTDSQDFEPWKGRFYSLTFSEYNKLLIQWLRLSTL